MPCNDQTERLLLELDAENCVRDFSLFKVTCQQPVGGSQLLPVIVGHDARSLLEPSVAEIVDVDLQQIEGFMLLKQLYAIQDAITVMFGLPPLDARPAFRLHELDYDGSRTLLTGEIAVDIIADQIRSCGGCRCSL